MNARMIGVAAPLILAVFAAVACVDDRDGFVSEGPRDFGGDAGSDAPAASLCPFQCSLDGRSIVRACTGEVVEQCPPELACGEARCQAPCAAAAADARSDGCEFYFQAPRFKRNLRQSCFAMFVVNTSIQAVDLSLDIDGASLDISKSVYRTTAGDATLIPHSGSLASGESAILFVSDQDPSKPTTGNGAACPYGVVPATYQDDLPNGTGYAPAFHLKSNVPVAVTSMYPFGGAISHFPTASLLLPVATWSKEHILINGWETGYSGEPAAQIVASEDDTEVTITPTRDIQDGSGVVGALAGTPASYRLAKGQLLQITQSEELSGSIVSSTKPTTIFGGHSAADIPTTGGTADVLAQQIPGFDRWGSEYVGVGYRPRLGNEHELVGYRIVAARDGTRLEYDPQIPAGAPVTMSAGEVAMFAHGTGNAFVVRTQDAEHPIYVSAHMSGQRQGFEGPAGGDTSFAQRGDPEVVNVIPTRQYLSSYSFYADPTYGDSSLVVVRAKSGGQFKDVWLECAGNLTGFRPIGTRGDYEYVRVDLSRDDGPGDKFGDGVCQTGRHRMRSEGPFTATLWGWDYCASYAYPGGTAQRKLVETPLVPVN